MLLGLTILLVGLFVSYLIVSRVLERASVVKVACSVISVYLSLVIVSGYYLEYFNVLLTPLNFLVVFVFVGYLMLFFRRKIQITVGTTDILPPILVFSLVFLIGIAPSFPSFFPVSASVDSATHFNIAKFIFEHDSHKNFKTFIEILSGYPWGSHLIIALNSKLFGIQLIRLIYPFFVFTAALTAVAVYGLSTESGRMNWTLGLASGVYVGNSVYVNDALARGAFWPHVMGSFLVVMLLWFLVDYGRKPQIMKLLPLALLEGALILIYPLWAPALLLVFFLTVFFVAHNSSGRGATHFLSFSVILLLISGIPVVEELDFVKRRSTAVLGYGSEPVGNIIETTMKSKRLLIFLLFPVPGILKSLFGRKNKVVLFFLAAVCLQTVLMYFGYSSSECKGMWYGIIFSCEKYWYYKMYYLLVYPLAVFSASTIGLIVKWFDYNADKRVTLLFVVLFLFGALFINHKLLFNHPLAVTPDEYKVGLWMSEKSLGNVIYVAEYPHLIWLSVLSGHPPKEQSGEWWLSSTSFEDIDAKVGDVVVVSNIGEVDSLGDFELLYRSGSAVVLRKNKV